MTRQVVFDLETTGLNAADGDRIIEIGAVELERRQQTGREFHRLLDPGRDIDADASRIHGFRREDLEGKPRFAEVAEELVQFIAGSQLIIHNAEFDLSFLNAELELLGERGRELREQYPSWTVLDTLQMARERHPGQRNSLDALIERYQIVGEDRDLHGALKDARLLVAVYLEMSRGQVGMQFRRNSATLLSTGQREIQRLPPGRPATPAIEVSAEEEQADRERRQAIEAVRAGEGSTGAA